VDIRLHLEMPAQPDDNTCGPTCLQAIYDYWQDPAPLDELIAGIPRTDSGGTLAVHLANHALARGYAATLYTYNLTLFDPTWFNPPIPDLPDRLRTQAQLKQRPKMQQATEAYLRFLELGGQLRYEDLTMGLIRRILVREIPILTGLCSTYLYRAVRERVLDNVDDDLLGEPTGHFVVLCGYDRENRSVRVADPYHLNPVGDAEAIYGVGIERVIGAILLGVLTHDANFLVIQPGSQSSLGRRRDSLTRERRFSARFAARGGDHSQETGEQDAPRGR
jgi:hypothetical protein